LGPNYYPEDGSVCHRAISLSWEPDVKRRGQLVPANQPVDRAPHTRSQAFLPTWTGQDGLHRVCPGGARRQGDAVLVAARTVMVRVLIGIVVFQSRRPDASSTRWLVLNTQAGEMLPASGKSLASEPSRLLGSAQFGARGGRRSLGTAICGSGGV